VLVPAVTWLYMDGNSGWGTFLAVWSAFVPAHGTTSCVPMLTSGRQTYFFVLPVFAGVVAGLIAFGRSASSFGPVSGFADRLQPDGSVDRAGFPIGDEPVKGLTTPIPFKTGTNQIGKPSTGDPEFVGHRRAEAAQRR